MTVRGTSSVNTSRLEALRNKHSIINSRIEEAQKSPSTADYYISQLKKKRLVLQEEIEGIRQGRGSGS